MAPCKQTASPKIFIISLFFRTFKNALQNILVQHDLFNDIRNFMKFEPLFAPRAQKVFFSKNIGKVFFRKIKNRSELSERTIIFTIVAVICYPSITHVEDSALHTKLKDAEVEKNVKTGARRSFAEIVLKNKIIQFHKKTATLNNFKEFYKN